MIAIEELVPDPSVSALTETEFLKFAQLIEQEIGIQLSEAKRPLLVSRLTRRIRRLALRSFDEYFDHIVSGDDPGEKVAMYDAITTNETRFFREPHHFEIMASRIFPRWKEQAAAGERARSIRVWSAGCSSGEEPYSIAMTLLEHFDPGQWELRVDATDLSTRVLEKAREGVWPLSKASGIPAAHLRRFMLRGTRSQQGFFKAGAELREIVRFARLNLSDERYGLSAGYDMVFCRNVLIYFGQSLRRRVVANLLSHARPGGYFFIGHAETLSGLAEGPVTIGPTVYVK